MISASLAIEEPIYDAKPSGRNAQKQTATADMAVAAMASMILVVRVIPLPNC
jgi:hypothetical protein